MTVVHPVTGEILLERALVERKATHIVWCADRLLIDIENFHHCREPVGRRFLLAMVAKQGARLSAMVLPAMVNPDSKPEQLSRRNATLAQAKAKRAVDDLLIKYAEVLRCA